MTTSYSKNIHLSNLSSKFAWSLEKIRTKYPKNHENYKNSNLKVQFYWFFIKKKCNSLLEYLATIVNSTHVLIF